MQHVFLGRTGLRVSTLAMGTMGFGPDRDNDRAMFSACRDAGVSLFDCADVYQEGDSERSLGSMVKGCRDEVVITSKAYFPMGPGPNDRGASRYHLVRAVEGSLRRLETDRIDIFFLHRFDDATSLSETLRAIDDLVRQGKILYPAVSNFAAWQAQAALGEAALRSLSPIVALQPMYNLVKRQAEVELLPMAQANGLGVFPYSPLGGGLLTGKYSTTSRPKRGRLLDVPMYTTRYADPENFAVAERFTALAAEVSVHPVSLAIAWVSAHPAVTAPLVGARNIAQLGPVLASADVKMTTELYDRIASLSKAPPPATDRNEERTPSNYGSR